jgi:hypothetical protein
MKIVKKNNTETITIKKGKISHLISTPHIICIVGTHKDGSPIKNFWGLRSECKENRNQWGNLSKNINSPSLALKPKAAALIAAANIKSAGWIKGPGPKAGSGYWAHTRSFTDANQALKYLAKSFGLCASDEATLTQLEENGVRWIPLCGKSKLKTLSTPEINPLTLLKSACPKTKKIYIDEGPNGYVKITRICGGPNDGYICLKNHRDKLTHLWAKIDLINDIVVAGGNFYNHPGYMQIGHDTRSPCCGGNRIPANPHPYIGARCFKSVDEAIRYLKIYFTVLGCGSNRKYTTRYINEL